MTRPLLTRGRQRRPATPCTAPRQRRPQARPHTRSVRQCSAGRFRSRDPRTSRQRHRGAWEHERACSPFRTGRRDGFPVAPCRRRRHRRESVGIRHSEKPRQTIEARRRRQAKRPAPTDSRPGVRSPGSAIIPTEHRGAGQRGRSVLRGRCGRPPRSAGPPDPLPRSRCRRCRGAPRAGASAWRAARRGPGRRHDEPRRSRR